MRERFLTANGLRLHYLEWENDGPDLLMVHPTGFIANIWQPLAERLAVRFRVLALDARGHGDSDKPADAYSADRFVDDLRAFITVAALRNPVGVGHSAGASTIAAVEATQPGTFRCTVLLEPILSLNPDSRPHEPSSEEDPMVARTRKRRANWPDRRSVYDAYRSRPTFEHWDEQILWQYLNHGFQDQQDGTVQLKCPPEAEAQMYAHGFHDLDGEPILPRVRCPVLLVRGEDSPAFSAAGAVRAATLLPNNRMAMLPGGHFAPFEHPRIAEAAIVQFLDQMGG